MNRIYMAAVMLLLMSSYGIALDIHRVLPNKINYKPGEQGIVRVVVGNNKDTAESAALYLFDCWDIDSFRIIGKRNVTVNPKSESVFEFAMDAGQILYGHALQAKLIRDDKTIAMKSEYINVIDKWWRVSFGIWTNTNSASPQSRRVNDWYHLPHDIDGLPLFSRFYRIWDMEPMGPFYSYFTNTTPWDMAHSDFGLFYIPELTNEDVWYARAEGPRTYNDFIEDTAICKKWGIHRTCFTISLLTSKAGFELGRKHPEHLLYNENGGYDVSSPTDPLGIAEKGLEKRYSGGWSYLKPNLANPKVIDFGLDAIITGLRHRGEDGVYFDGAYEALDGFDYQGNRISDMYNLSSVTDYNMLRTIEKLKAFRKDLYVWVNGANRGSTTKILTDPDIGALYEINTFYMNEKGASTFWMNLFENCISARNDMWAPGERYSHIKSNILNLGYFPIPRAHSNPQNIAQKQATERALSTNDHWVLCNHIGAIAAAVCGHLYGSGESFRPITQLMTRYSEFYWHEDISLIRNAYKSFNVDGLREVMWEDFVYTRKTPNYVDYYIHLVNVPDQSHASIDMINETKAAEDIEVSSKMFPKRNLVESWAIQPYSSTAQRLEPIVEKIVPGSVDGETTFLIPAFRYYTLLIIRHHNDR